MLLLTWKRPLADTVMLTSEPSVVVSGISKNPINEDVESTPVSSYTMPAENALLVLIALKDGSAQSKTTVLVVALSVNVLLVSDNRA